MNKQELIKKIADEHTIHKGYAEIIINAIDVEGWLRDPDQVLGRTITESEVARLFDMTRTAASDERLREIGLTIVDDPEPTIPVPSEAGVRFIAYSPKYCDDYEDQHEFIVASGYVVDLSNGALFKRVAFAEDWNVTSLVTAPGGDNEN